MTQVPPAAPRVRIRHSAETPPWHMLSHACPAPEMAPLDCELYQVAIPQARGRQHNPSVFSWKGELWTSVRDLLPNGASDTYLAKVIRWGQAKPPAKGPSDFGADEQVVTPVTLDCPHRVPLGYRSAPVQHGYVRAPRPMMACEDLRPFEWAGKLWAIGAAPSGAGPLLAVRQALLEISDDGHDIMSTHVVPSARNEKNWMPLVEGKRGEEELSLVYSVDPLISLSVGKTLTSISAYGVPQVTGHVRGGSQLVPFDLNLQLEGHLALVHQVYRPSREAPGHNTLLSGGWAPIPTDPAAGGEPVVYAHQFALFVAGHDVVLSKPFYFLQIGIEFGAGLAWWDEGAGELVASFGFRDEQAWLAVFGREVVEELFEE